MGIFRRWYGARGSSSGGSSAGGSSAGGAGSAPLPGLPMFADGQRAARFAVLAREVFAEHGMECLYDDGYLRGADGSNYGLTNVALLAVREREREWKGLLRQHASGIVAASATPRQRELSEVRDRLYLRLWPTADLPIPPHAAEPLGRGTDPALVGLASIDHPEHVETITGAHDLELLGGWPAIREAALANLARLHADEVVPIGDDPASRVQLSVGGFFNASRVFTMTHLLREDFLVESPSYGVLFAVPNRHLVAVHPLAGAGMVAATTTLARLARGESEVPGAISPHVWFWRDGVVQQVSHLDEQSGDAPTTDRHDDSHDGPHDDLVLRVEGPLEVAMRELGLIEDL